MKDALIILGGMGPQASIKLHELLILGSQTFHNGSPSSYPLILHASLPVPDFVDNPDNYEPAVGLIQRSCKSLPLDTASAIGIACNTAHLMLDELQLPSRRFVSMINAVVDSIVHNQVTSIGLLASPHTIKTGLYSTALEGNGLRVIEPKDNDTVLLGGIIHDVISGVDPKLLQPKLTDIAKRLADQGAEAILLGCTELPLIGLTDDIKTFDSLQCLANAMLAKHYQR